MSAVPPLTREVLEDLYIKQALTVQEVATRLGCGTSRSKGFCLAIACVSVRFRYILPRVQEYYTVILPYCPKHLNLLREIEEPTGYAGVVSVGKRKSFLVSGCMSLPVARAGAIVTGMEPLITYTREGA